MNPLDRVIAFGTIIAAAIKGDRKAILATVRELASEDDPTTQEGGQDEQQVYSAPMYLNPDPPSDLGACECVALRTQDGLPVVAMRDVRLNRRANPKTGELGMTHYGGGLISMKWNGAASGTNVAILAPRLASDAVDKSHALVMDSAASTASVTLTHQLGHGVILDKDGNVTIKSADGTNYLTVGPDGLQGGFAGGAKLVGGVIAGDAASAKAVALSPEVVAAFGAVVTALGTASTQLIALGQTGLASDIASLTSAISTLGAAGTATTLKASPV